MKNKLISIILAAAMVLTSVPAPVFALDLGAEEAVIQTDVPAEEAPPGEESEPAIAEEPTASQPETLGVPYTPPKREEETSAEAPVENADPQTAEAEGEPQQTAVSAPSAEPVTAPSTEVLTAPAMFAAPLRSPATGSIPVVAGPDASGTTLSFTGEDGGSFTLSIPSAGPYVLRLDSQTSGVPFYLRYVVTNDTEELGGSWFSGSYDSSSQCFFTVPAAGSYTVLVDNVRYESVYDSETGTYVEYTGEQAFSVSAKAYKTVEAPSIIGMDEEWMAITEPFTLRFNVPEGCDVWYYVQSGGHGMEPEYVLYDASHPVTVNGIAHGQAYAQSRSNSALKSEEIYFSFEVDVETPECSAAWPNHIVEDGGSVTLTTSDPSISIYYQLSTEELGWGTYSAETIKKNGQL